MIYNTKPIKIKACRIAHIALRMAFKPAPYIHKVHHKRLVWIMQPIWRFFGVILPKAKLYILVLPPPVNHGTNILPANDAVDSHRLPIHIAYNIILCYVVQQFTIFFV